MKTIGIVGLGSIGMRHAANLIDMGHRVIGYDPIEECGKMLQKLGGIPLSAGEFIEAERDGLIIATPSKDHVRNIVVFHDKHVLVEKPVGVSWGDATLFGDLIKVRSIMVGNNLRFHPGIQRVKDHLTDMKPIWARFVISQYNDKPDYIRDGVTLNWGAHEVDLALYLLGPAHVAVADISRKDDIADILLDHESGCRTHIHLDYLLKQNMRGFEIMSEEKNIYGDLIEGVFLVEGEDESKGISSKIDWNETYIREMRAFIDRIDGKEDKIGANGEDGLECLRILLRAKRFK